MKINVNHIQVQYIDTSSPAIMSGSSLSYSVAPIGRMIVSLLLAAFRALKWLLNALVLTVGFLFVAYGCLQAAEDLIVFLIQQFFIGR